MTTRELIVQGVENALKTLTSLKSVRSIFSSSIQELETLPYPSALIFPMAERSYPTQVIGREVWELDIAVEIWDRTAKSIEGLIGEITQKLYTTLIHSSVHDVKRSGIEYFYPEGDLYGARLTFTLIYSHDRENP